MQEPIHELDVVALLEDIPSDGLTVGQTGTVVFVHRDGNAFEVEFPLEPRRSVVATINADKLLRLRGLREASTHRQ